MPNLESSKFRHTAIALLTNGITEFIVTTWGLSPCAGHGQFRCEIDSLVESLLINQAAYSAVELLLWYINRLRESPAVASNPKRV